MVITNSREQLWSEMSTCINRVRFPLIFMIILLHCYSVVQLPGSHPIYFKTIYPFALWLGETGVPGFFFISGYLFYRNTRKSYRDKIQTRFRTLLSPYIIWNSLLLAIYLIAYLLGHPQDINGKNIADFSWTDYLRLYWDRGNYDNGNFVPLLCPYWYIRNLLILSLFSPVIYFIIKHIGKIFILAISIWWMLTYNNAFIPQSILFFSLGAFFSIHDIIPIQIFKQWKSVFGGLFVVFGLADICTHAFSPCILNLQIHRLALIANIPILFLIASYSTSTSKVATLLGKSSFIVFSISYPIIVLLRKGCVMFFGSGNDYTHILLYICCIVVSTLLSLLFYLSLPTKISNILSGNRS